MDHDELPQELCDGLDRVNDTLDKALGSIDETRLTWCAHVDEPYEQYGVQVRLEVRGIKNGNELAQLATALNTICGRLRGAGA